MTAFKSAVSFLTTLPFARSTSAPGKEVVSFFPLVGLLIGGMLVGVDFLGGLFLSGPARALVDVLFLIVITGGIHMDGLGDSADGVFSHKDKNRILEIMKDPRMGVMGTMAIILAILFKAVGLSQIPVEDGWIFLLMVPALARCSQVTGLAFMENARGESSLGSAFYATSKKSAVGLSIVFLAPVFFAGWKVGLAISILFILTNLIVLMFMQKKIGGMTGDTLGALTEITETFLFLTAGEMYRVYI